MGLRLDRGADDHGGTVLGSRLAAVDHRQYFHASLSCVDARRHRHSAQFAQSVRSSLVFPTAPSAVVSSTRSARRPGGFAFLKIFSCLLLRLNRLTESECKYISLPPRRRGMAFQAAPVKAKSVAPHFTVHARAIALKRPDLVSSLILSCYASYLHAVNVVNGCGVGSKNSLLQKWWRQPASPPLYSRRHAPPNLPILFNRQWDGNTLPKRPFSLGSDYKL